MHKINHSCAPNAGIQVNETGGHNIVAFKKIKVGEEIVLDYAMRNYQIEHFPPKCRCGARHCRKTITGWKDLPDHKKEEYKGFTVNYLLQM